MVFDAQVHLEAGLAFERVVPRAASMAFSDADRDLMDEKADIIPLGTTHRSEKTNVLCIANPVPKRFAHFTVGYARCGPVGPRRTAMPDHRSDAAGRRRCVPARGAAGNQDQ